MHVVLSFLFNCPLIAYFLKKNYSLRQNIFEIFEGLREVTHINPNWCFLDLIEVGTRLGIGSTKDFEDLLEKE